MPKKNATQKQRSGEAASFHLQRRRNKELVVRQFEVA